MPLYVKLSNVSPVLTNPSLSKRILEERNSVEARIANFKRVPRGPRITDVTGIVGREGLGFLIPPTNAEVPKEK